VTGPFTRKLLGALLIAAAAGFLVHAIVVNWQALRAHEWRVDLPLLIVSIVGHVAVLAWGVMVWRRVLGYFTSIHIAHRLLLRIWFLSNLARYVPGKIFQFVAVAHLGKTAGIPSGVLLASLLVHTALALLSAAVLAAWTLGGLLIPAAPLHVIGFTATVIAVGLVHPAFLNRVLRLVGRAMRHDLLRWHGSWGSGLLLFGLSVVSWLLYGLVYFAFLSSLTPLPIGTLPQLSGINALSFVAGYVAFVTPGGLGAREAAMTVLLLPLVPASVAAVLAMASRLWTIVAEVMGGVVALLVSRRHTAGTETSPTSARAERP
jgi:glycosyltransferase 2 family protein